MLFQCGSCWPSSLPFFAPYPSLPALCLWSVTNWWWVVTVRQHDDLSLNLCVSVACLLRICLSVHPWETNCMFLWKYFCVCVCVCSIFRHLSSKMHLGKRYEFSQASMILSVSSLSFLFFFFSLYYHHPLFYSFISCNIPEYFHAQKRHV